MEDKIEKDVCYFCGGLSTSREHAPPKHMFRVVECDSIKVPSCDDHNSKKSGCDQAIVAAFLIPLRSYIKNPEKRKSIEPLVTKAVKFAEKSFERTKRRAILSTMLSNTDKYDIDQPEIAYLVPDINIKKWIIQLTAAINYAGINGFDPTIDWSSSLTWSPSWLEVPSPEPLDLECVRERFLSIEELNKELAEYKWHVGWSSKPRPYPHDIYYFELAFPHKGSYIMRHIFYNRFTWYIAVFAREKVIDLIRKRCDK